jgi:hypothetical protein
LILRMPFEFMQIPANGQGGLMRCESRVYQDWWG